MRAVDTNILARFILNDDDAQTSIANDVIRGGVYVSLSVWMELVWLLGARYRFSRDMIAEALEVTMKIDVVVTPEAAFWALDRYRLGADLADMIHLIEAQAHEGFHTFDRGMKKDAGAASPVPVELLR